MIGHSAGFVICTERQLHPTTGNEAAVRAPSGANTQDWRFLLLDSPEVKAKLGPIYRDGLNTVFNSIYKPQFEGAEASPGAPESTEFQKMYRSANWFAENFESYPLMLFAFCRGDTTGASIYPAVWSAMLAVRAEDVGCAITSVLLFHHKEMLDILGVPPRRRLAIQLHGHNGLSHGSLGHSTATPRPRSGISLPIGSPR